MNFGSIYIIRQRCSRVPNHLENLENLENEKISFPGLEKSWKKEKQEHVLEKSCKFLKIRTKL